MSEANRRGHSSEARSEKGEMRRVRAGAAEFSTRSTRSTRLIQNEERSLVYSRVAAESRLSVCLSGKFSRRKSAAVLILLQVDIKKCCGCFYFSEESS